MFSSPWHLGTLASTRVHRLTRTLVGAAAAARRALINKSKRVEGPTQSKEGGCAPRGTEQVTEQVTKQFVPIKAGTEKLVSILDSTLRSITTLTDKASLLIEANHTNLTNAVENIDTLASVFTSQREEITSILNNLNLFTEDLVKANVDEAIGTLNKTMINFNSVIADVKSGEGSLGKLIQDDDLYSEINETIGQLELLLLDMRENPKRYVHFSLFGRKEAVADSLK